jgi:hypothetical protein
MLQGQVSQADQPAASKCGSMLGTHCSTQLPPLLPHLLPPVGAVIFVVVPVRSLTTAENAHPSEKYQKASNRAGSW